MRDNVGLRAGVLDDQSILDKPPAIEVFVERRPRVSKPLCIGAVRFRWHGHESGYRAGSPAGFIPSLPGPAAHEIIKKNKSG